jgi:hypothetical protein
MINSNVSHALPLRPPGAQALGAQFRDWLELVSLLDGPRFVSSSTVVPFEQRVPPSHVNVQRWTPPTGRSIRARRALPVRECYRIASIALSGRLPEALSEARALAAAAAALVDPGIVAVALEALDEIRRQAAPEYRPEPGTLFEVAQRAKLEARLRAERVNALLPNGAVALRRELFNAGVVDGLRVADATAVAVLFPGRASAFGPLVPALYHQRGAVAEDYGAALLEAGGVPMSQTTFRAAAPEVRDLLTRDPTFNVDELPLALDPGGRPEELVQLEAAVDAGLLAVRR